MRVDFLRFPVASGVIIVGCAFLPMDANAGSEIRRCIDGGHVTYTDRGCTDQGEGVVVAMASVSANGSAHADGGYGRVLPVTLGMSPRMVYDAMGRPLETIATLEGRALVEYWVYRGLDGTTRVAFQDGRVTRIHAR